MPHGPDNVYNIRQGTQCGLSLKEDFYFWATDQNSPLEILWLKRDAVRIIVCVLSASSCVTFKDLTWSFEAYIT